MAKKPRKQTNAVSPDHYKGDIECIDALRTCLTPEEFQGYCKGNIIKYAWRERLKNGKEDVKKAAWYVEQLINL